MPYIVNPTTGDLEYRETAGSIGAVISITTDDGAPPVLPDGTGNINFVGGAGIDVDGNGPGNTVTISLETPITVPQGGTGQTTLTDRGVLIGNGVNPVVQTAAGTDGQVFIASSTLDPAFATLTSSDGSITFTPGSNSLSLQAAIGGPKTITGNDLVVLAPVGDNWNIFGSSTAAGTSPVTTTGVIGTATLTVNVQKSQALAATDATKVGLANFDSTAFDVDANGFVQLNGGGIASTSFNVEANTAPGTDPVVPTAAGVVTVNGAVVANHSVVMETRSRAANAYNVEVQYATSAAAADGTKSGVAHFNSTQFTMGANGFVSTSGTGVLSTITGNDTVVVSPTAGNINVVGTGSITTSGSGSTETIQLTGLTNHAVLVGAGTATITKVGPTATAGQVLQSAGSSLDPAFSTATYPSTTTINRILYSSANDVVGQITTANNGVLITGTTGIPSLLANGTTGQLLTATINNPPTWTTVARIATINGDTGSITGTTVRIYANNAALGAGSSVLFANLGTDSTFTVTDGLSNTMIGSGAGKAGMSGANNAAIGRLALSSLTSGDSNMAFGSSALAACNSGNYNVAVGVIALQSVTTTSQNVAIGRQALQQIVTGANNIAIGYQAGVNLTTNDSNNIILGNAGTLGDNARIRIGTNGTQTSAFIQGISGVTVTGPLVNINTSGQLGTTNSVATAWTDVSGSVTAASGNGYFATTTTTSTLPASPAQGDIVRYVVDTTNLLTIQAAGSQVIRIGTTVSAAGGTCINTQRGDAIELVYRSTGTAWIAANNPVGGWNIT